MLNYLVTISIRSRSVGSAESIHLNNLLEETIATPSIQSDAQHLTLGIELPEENIPIEGNPDLLTQAIVNLI
jgi:signal transduction histidine kinase